jgi:hypothetical protein
MVRDLVSERQVGPVLVSIGLRPPEPPAAQLPRSALGAAAVSGPSAAKGPGAIA